MWTAGCSLACWDSHGAGAMETMHCYETSKPETTGCLRACWDSHCST
jgi:hypothetical protein